MRLFVDNLTNIDFSYLCPKRGLVGETWLANIELMGKPDQQGMICDFGIVKRQLRQWLDCHLDHCLLVPSIASSISLQRHDKQLSISLICEDKSRIDIESPEQAISVINAPEITPLSVARWCEEALGPVFPNSELAISFTSEEIKSPYYHYSHGLKKHSGDCQRIAHGHRSKLFIWRNDVLSHELMEDWANKLSDIYIATQEDCVADENETMTFRYEASQGHFRLRIPRSRCYVIDTDTTVEHIAQHLADKISALYTSDYIVVKAFEGIGKGAIAEGKGKSYR